MAYLVRDPLEVSFTIQKDLVTKVSPELLSTNLKKPGDFGYVNFGINEVEVIDFLVAAFIYNDAVSSFELTDASITVTSNDTMLYEGDLEALTNILRVTANYTMYDVRVYKPGYSSFIGHFTADSLALFFNNPLTVILKEQDLPTGLIAYYPFDGNADDYSGNDNNCIDSTQGVYTTGMVNEALSFDGYNDYLQLTRTLDGSEGLTFSFWIYLKGVQPGEINGTVICKYNMYSDYTCFSVSTIAHHTNIPALHGSFFASQSSTDYRDCAWSEWMTTDDIPYNWSPSSFTIHNPKTLPLNEWSHCVINVSDTHIQAWIDGVLCVEKQREYALYLNDPDEQTFIGNNLYGGQGSNNHLYGLLDDLRVYNRSLTEEEIGKLYQLEQ